MKYIFLLWLVIINFVSFAQVSESEDDFVDYSITYKYSKKGTSVVDTESGQLLFKESKNEAIAFYFDRGYVIVNLKTKLLQVCYYNNGLFIKSEWSKSFKSLIYNDLTFYPNIAQVMKLGEYFINPILGYEIPVENSKSVKLLSENLTGMEFHFEDSIFVSIANFPKRFVHYEEKANLGHYELEVTSVKGKTIVFEEDLQRVFYHPDKIIGVKKVRPEYAIFENEDYHYSSSEVDVFIWDKLSGYFKYQSTDFDEINRIVNFKSNDDFINYYNLDTAKLLQKEESIIKVKEPLIEKRSGLIGFLNNREIVFEGYEKGLKVYEIDSSEFIISDYKNSNELLLQQIYGTKEVKSIEPFSIDYSDKLSPNVAVRNYNLYLIQTINETILVTFHSGTYKEYIHPKGTEILPYEMIGYLSFKGVEFPKFNFYNGHVIKFDKELSGLNIDAKTYYDEGIGSTIFGVQYFIDSNDILLSNTVIADMNIGFIDYGNYRVVKCFQEGETVLQEKIDNQTGSTMYDSFGDPLYEDIIVPGTSRSGVYNLKTNKWLVEPESMDIWITDEGFTCMPFYSHEKDNSAAYNTYEHVSFSGEKTWKSGNVQKLRMESPLLKYFGAPTSCVLNTYKEGIVSPHIVAMQDTSSWKFILLKMDERMRIIDEVISEMPIAIYEPDLNEFISFSDHYFWVCDYSKKPFVYEGFELEPWNRMDVYADNENGNIYYKSLDSSNNYQCFRFNSNDSVRIYGMKLEREIPNELLKYSLIKTGSFIHCYAPERWEPAYDMTTGIPLYSEFGDPIYYKYSIEATIWKQNISGNWQPFTRGAEPFVMENFVAVKKTNQSSESNQDVESLVYEFRDVKNNLMQNLNALQITSLSLNKEHVIEARSNASGKLYLLDANGEILKD